ncbi:MAG: methyltransferase domain-containing protein [Proteobacteria bacterium]|nr:methyltransferase domain-containing protein [Pseudomonadota bacterium]
MAETPAAGLLLDHLQLLTSLDHTEPVLDLACGNGRNGLALAAEGLDVIFADRSADSLKAVEALLSASGLPGSTWLVDLEQDGINPLSGRCFSAILCFRYLHRPLLPMLKKAIIPGGLIVYETFTTDNRRFGRPNNSDFLLRPGELKAIFEDWDVIHSFEGILQNPDRAIAQLVARKPAN